MEKFVATVPRTTSNALRGVAEFRAMPTKDFRRMRPGYSHHDDLLRLARSARCDRPRTVMRERWITADIPAREATQV